VQCREQIMEEEVALTMFETDKYSAAVKQGQIMRSCCIGVYLCLSPRP